MNRVILSSAVVTIAALIGFTACKKNNDDKYEKWQVHNYCVAQREGVICAQDDTVTMTLCCDQVGKYHAGQTTIVSSDANIIYYQTFIKLLTSN